MRNTSGRLPSRRWLIVAAWLGAVQPAVSSAVPVFRLQTGLRSDIASTVLQARSRLETPECARVVGDFADASGRPLEAVLESDGRSVVEHFDRLFFYDGTAGRPCADAGTVAFTTPGSRVVFVCPRQFARLRQVNPREAEYIVIHETLHTLGLAENPPTSRAITRAVEKRCATRVSR